MAQIWKIELGPVQQNLKTTPQVRIIHDVDPLTHWYKTDIIPGYNASCLNTTMYFDTLFPKFRSLNGNICAQIFTDTEFISLHPSKSKAEYRNFINEFIDDIIIPINMRFHHASNLLGKGTKFMNSINSHCINFNVTEPYSH